MIEQEYMASDRFLQDLADAERQKNDAIKSERAAAFQYAYEESKYRVKLMTADPNQTSAWYKAQITIESGTEGTLLNDLRIKVVAQEAVVMTKTEEYWRLKHRFQLMKSEAFR